MLIEILFKMVLFEGGVLIYTEHCMREPNNNKLEDAVLICRAQLQEMIHEETTFALFKLKRKYFESGDKAGKMLAMRLKQMEAKHFILNIHDCDGQNVQEPKQTLPEKWDFRPRKHLKISLIFGS